MVDMVVVGEVCRRKERGQSKRWSGSNEFTPLRHSSNNTILLLGHSHGPSRPGLSPYPRQQVPGCFTRLVGFLPRLIRRQQSQHPHFGPDPNSALPRPGLGLPRLTQQNTSVPPPSEYIRPKHTRTAPPRLHPRASARHRRYRNKPVEPDRSN